MGFILFMIFIMVLFSSYANAKKLQAKSTEYVVEADPVCPPHKWRYQEIKDTEGKTVKWKMVCDICGPLKPSNGPARMD